MANRILDKHARDHVIHSLLCFMIGIYINNRFLNPLNISIDVFQWKIAGLLHDIGYPIQIASDILKAYSSKINNIKEGINSGHNVDFSNIIFKVRPVNFNVLTIQENTFTLIQKYLDEWGLKINAEKVYNDSIKCGGICHGMISALTILNVTDLMYQKNNPKRETRYYSDGNIDWNQEYFIKDIVPACAAIYVHNLPKKCFKNAKIDSQKAPLAFLLKLSDCIQDWDRPSKENIHGFPSSEFNVHVNNNQLFFTVPKKRRTKIMDEIQSYLVASNIYVL